ncbi:hypothetical protein [Rouxiella sp. Mn2063]|uniref:hypothetical protein n=1 Tax=Rouxiella sp. Mn2063 TaxID=3395262 RepID=UPI003BD6F740
MRNALLCALLALSPLSAIAGSTVGQIGVSLTILPSCRIDIADNNPAVSCAGNNQQHQNQPHISKVILKGAPGIAVDTSLITLEW